MEFAFTAEQEALRSDVQQFIAENVTDEIISELEDTGIRRRGPKTREMYRKIAERGWIGISWPTEYGGQDGSRIDQYIVEEEFARIGITVGGAGSGAPAILAAGTEEQKREFIPGVIRGEISFALGFTEPQAGADLAGLQCRAVRDGDDYVINGQKMYTTAAHYATHIYLMARTDPGRAAPPRNQHLPHPDGHAWHHGAASVDHPKQPAGSTRYHVWRRSHQRNVLRKRCGCRRPVSSAKKTRAGTSVRWD